MGAAGPGSSGPWVAVHLPKILVVFVVMAALKTCLPLVTLISWAQKSGAPCAYRIPRAFPSVHPSALSPGAVRPGRVTEPHQGFICYCPLFPLLFLFLKTGSHYVTLVHLELYVDQTSLELCLPQSPSAGIKGVSLHVHPAIGFLMTK